jgi:hypothetical protein
MRRRLPSPALVIASLALFVALAGAGVAASVALVKSPKPITLVPGSVSAAGKVTGAHLTGTRVSQGVYTLTISGNTFAATKAPIAELFAVARTSTPGHQIHQAQYCGTAREAIASNGSATAEVDCLAYDPATGWTPADTPFDVEMIGPGH